MSADHIDKLRLNLTLCIIGGAVSELNATRDMLSSRTERTRQLVNRKLFTGCRAAIGEKQMKRGQRTKLDELVLHEPRFAQGQLFHPSFYRSKKTFIFALIARHY
jgi:hypothetical protein